jgi:outer membrane receptor protein involved in Fe transport
MQLNPFEVKADPDTSYGALNSNAITRFSAELEKLPVSADIFTQRFMEDIAADSIEAMLQAYSAGAGFSTSSPETSVGVQTGDYISGSSTQLRGFGTPAMTRDGLMPLGTFYNPGSTAPGFSTNFDVERVEVLHGPQTLLFSSGGSGGAINVVSKQAQFNHPTKGSLKFQLDRYGSKQGQADYSVGGRKAAFRLALLGSSQRTRRVFIGQSVSGTYLQGAIRIGEHTTVRLTGQQTALSGIYQTSANTLTTTAADPRNGAFLSYLLASGKAGATNPATGAPYPSGALVNGLLDWNNVNSFGGSLYSQRVVNTFGILSAETRWAPWLTSQLSTGYNDFRNDHAGPSGGMTFLAPQAASNTTGKWAVSARPDDLWVPARTKSLRFSLLASNSFQDGRGRTQTIVGGDFVRTDSAQIQYAYYRADADFNVIVNPAVTTSFGRTLFGTQTWSVAEGPVKYPYFSPNAQAFTYNGLNYVRQINNVVNPALISPTNPMGTSSTATYQISKLFNQGFYAINYTQWNEGRISTLLGVRRSHNFYVSQLHNNPYLGSVSHTVSFDAGVDVRVTDALSVYGEFSNSHVPPQFLSLSPDGTPPGVRRGLGQELGMKFRVPKHDISGTLAVYHTVSRNEQMSVSSTLQNDVNPTGLNGRGATGGGLSVDRETYGVEAALTARPTAGWRVRLSAAETVGRIASDRLLPQYYNDQFYQNSAGQVTYADRTPVYVNGTAFNAKAPTVAATAAGAVPLTLAMMNNPASLYYAAPVNPTGQIGSGTAVATVLRSTDPVHGAILTGAVGLPISALQITPNFALPGSILATRAGDRTLGYPRYSFNVTNVYTFSGGPARGLRVGGSFAAHWNYANYYYYPDGFVPNGRRAIFAAPNQILINPLLGYSHRFARVTWSTQLNISNLFNHYRVVILPGVLTGWTTETGLKAAFFGQPRTWQWSNTLGF